jgi:hypothetical protein
MARTPKDDRKGYLFLIQNVVENKKFPPYQLICDEMGYSSKRSAQLMLARLERLRLISRTDGKWELVGDDIHNAVSHTVESLIGFNNAVHALGQVAWTRYYDTQMHRPPVVSVTMNNQTYQYVTKAMTSEEKAD